MKFRKQQLSYDILNIDARNMDLFVEPKSVQMCVTSPPYFGLRSYMPDAVKLRGDINPEELASVLKELERLGVSPCSHT